MGTPNHPEHSIDRQIISQQLTNAVQLLASQSQTVWTLLSVFVAINAILALADVEGARATSREHLSKESLVVALFGLVSAALWFELQWDTLSRMAQGDELIRRLEASLHGLDLNLALPPLAPRGVVQWAMLLFPVMMGLAWVGSVPAIYFFQMLHE